LLADSQSASFTEFVSVRPPVVGATAAEDGEGLARYLRRRQGND
jgi:hypothetical protein